MVGLGLPGDEECLHTIFIRVNTSYFNGTVWVETATMCGYVRGLVSTRSLLGRPRGNVQDGPRGSLVQRMDSRWRYDDAYRSYSSSKPEYVRHGQDDDGIGNDMVIKMQSRGGQQGGVTTNATDDMLLSRMDDSKDVKTVGGTNLMHDSLLLTRQHQGVVTKKILTSPKTEVTSQHFGGALTTLVFGASLLSERLNGVGIVQNLELHNKGFHPILLSAIALLLVASAWPEKREWKNPTLLVRIQMAGARFAYLGLAGAIAAEMVTGRGVLSLLDVETGVEAFSDVEAVLIFLTMLVLTGPQSREIR